MSQDSSSEPSAQQTNGSSATNGNLKDNLINSKVRSREKMQSLQSQEGTLTYIYFKRPALLLPSFFWVIRAR
jgi:hypothetical protein